jgi:sugar phosphate isomerase/epimerase
MEKTRRIFIKTSSQMALGVGFLGIAACNSKMNNTTSTKSKLLDTMDTKGLFFKLSLAQWSLHRAIFGKKMDNLDFAAKAKDMGFEGIEYVNQFFFDKAKNMDYLKEMKMRAEDNGVKSLLIMIDNEGGLGEPDKKMRKEAVEKHYKWVDAAKFLGCHSIRVNAFGIGSAEEVAKGAVDALGTLAEYAKNVDLNVIVENHGGYSSNGKWLRDVMQQINMPSCGTLPDFGNFCIKRDSGQEWGGKCIEEYDRYKGVEEMMKFAKAVSAKANNFDENGNEVETDYMRMMKIVKDAGYKGYVGVEFEGSKMSEEQGIIATRDLLIKVGKALS